MFLLLTLTEVISHNAIVLRRYNDFDVGLAHLVAPLHEHVALAAAADVATLEEGRLRLEELQSLTPFYGANDVHVIYRLEVF